jgi:hypothetical protein
MKFLLFLIFLISVFAIFTICPMLPTANAYTSCGVSGIGIASSNPGGNSIMYYPQPQRIGSRLTDIEVYAYPYNASPQDQNTTLRISLCDTNSTTPILHVTYELSISPKNDTKPIFHDIFHSHAVLLTLNFQNPLGQNNVGSPTYDASRDSSLLNSRVALGPNGTINVTSPVLHKVGEYDINVKILGLDKDKIIYNENNAPSFHYYLRIGDRFFTHVSYKDQNYTILIAPYFGKVYDFSFDPNQPKLSWSLSANGTVGTSKIFSNAIVSVHIQKPFTEFSGSPFPLNVSVNGITLPNHGVYFGMPFDDPDSKDYFGILIDTTSALRGSAPRINSSTYESATYSFSLSPIKQTSVKYDEIPSRVLALVSWNPNPLLVNGSATATIKFFTRDGTPLKNTVYDINMHPPTGQGFEGRTALVAKNSTDIQRYNFSQNGIYRMHLYVRGVSNSSFPYSIDNTLDGDADGYVFVVPEFPFTMLILVIGLASMVIFYRIRLTKLG